MRSKWQQNLVYQDYVFEIVYNTFPIQKIHGSPEEVPVQRPCEL